jgi:hypothetical protein
LEDATNKRQDYACLLDFYDRKREQLERGIAMVSCLGEKSSKLNTLVLMLQISTVTYFEFQKLLQD